MTTTVRYGVPTIFPPLPHYPIPCQRLYARITTTPTEQFAGYFATIRLFEAPAPPLLTPALLLAPGGAVGSFAPTRLTRTDFQLVPQRRSNASQYVHQLNPVSSAPRIGVIHCDTPSPKVVGAPIASGTDVKVSVLWEVGGDELPIAGSGSLLLRLPAANSSSNSGIITHGVSLFRGGSWLSHNLGEVVVTQVDSPIRYFLYFDLFSIPLIDN